jgi:ComF family protein
MTLLDLIYPPRCTFCHAFVKNGKILICDECKNDLPFTTDNGRQKVPHLSVCVAPLRYEKDVKDSLHRFKFAGCTGYAKAYAPYVAECIRDAIGTEFDILSFVPVSRKRKKHRGYDQSVLLAKEVGKLLGVCPIRTLRKVRNNPPQSLTERVDERRKNVSDVYRAFRPRRFAGKRVLLLDDIITTGSTVSECAKTLKSAGAKEVLCGAVARAGS